MLSRVLPLIQGFKVVAYEANSGIFERAESRLHGHALDLLGGASFLPPVERFNKLPICVGSERLSLLRRGFPQARPCLVRGRAPSDKAQTTRAKRTG
jgi:hypothetical protein